MSVNFKSNFTRRSTLALLLSAGASSALGQGVTQSPLPKARPSAAARRIVPKDWVALSGLSGQTAFAIARDNASALAVRQADQQMPPASVAKIVTALYALEHLGDERRFVTRLMSTGEIKEGRLHGDLILAGGGDPTLDTDRLNELAQALRARGIQSITGQFYVYDKALPRIEQVDDGQSEYAGYNPTISGLNLNYNRVHFEWKRQGDAYALKMDARGKNRAPLVKMAKMKIVSRDVPVFDHVAGQGKDEWTVAKSALGNGGARWLPVRLPAIYAGDVFRSVAGGAGISLPAAKRIQTLGDTKELARVQSAPMKVLVRDMLKYSTNITAEVLGLTASRARGLRATSLRASARDMSDWARARFGLTKLQFVDHSGLGDASKVSAKDMVQILSSPGVQARLSPLLKPIKMKDQNGKVIQGHSTSVAAKTGTLDFVSALAGYVTGPRGQTAAFAIFSADQPARRAAKAAGNEVPRGARSFNSKAKKLQQALLQDWSSFHAL